MTTRPTRDPRRSLLIGGTIAVVVLAAVGALLLYGVAVVVSGRPG